jgi:hypothetical protein
LAVQGLDLVPKDYHKAHGLEDVHTLTIG